MELFEKFTSFISSAKFYGPILALFGGYLAYFLIKFILNKVVIPGKTELDVKRRKTVLQLLQNILKYIIYIVVILIILEIYGINTGTIIAGLGIAGLIVGLAFQDMLKDLIAGVTILMDNYFVIGDTVEYRGFKGEIINLGLRSTKIQKYSGEVETVANRNIDVIINYSQKSSHQLFEISTEYDIDIDTVEKILNSVSPKIYKVPNVIKDEVKYLGISEITLTSTKHLLTMKCKRMTQYQVRRDVMKLLKKEFDAKKIKISIS